MGTTAQHANQGTQPAAIALHARNNLRDERAHGLLRLRWVEAKLVGDVLDALPALGLAKGFEQVHRQHSTGR